APSISLQNISNNTILKTGTQMNFEIIDLHFDVVGWSWDSAITTYYDSPIFAVYAPPIEGMHQLLINATDEAGNSHSESYQFVIDNTDPVIVLSSPNEGETIAGGTSITLDVFDLHLSSVYFRWDLSEWDEWSAPYVTTSPLNEGYHSLFVNATDEAGNTVQVVFVFLIVSGTDTTTTTYYPPIDLPASLGILVVGLTVGIGVTLILLQILTRRRLRGSSAS
ncbi:MAG: hypothetical protein ACFFEE_09860, partial [Candidatus Thorarchaeota archaeon]